MTYTSDKRRDKLTDAVAGTIVTATVCGVITWAAWGIHVIAGWLG